MKKEQIVSMEKNVNKSKMEKKSSIIWGFTWTVLLLQSIITAAFMRFLPDRIPMHFNSNGEVDRYGSKSELLFLLILTAFVILMCKALTKSNKEELAKSEDERVRNTAATKLYVTSLFSLLLTLIMAGVTISLAVNGLTPTEESDGSAFLDIFMMIMNAGFGLMLILLGNAMPKTGINSSFGVRTSWSRYNNETWAQTNRAGGKITVATGFVCLIVALFVNYRYALFIISALIIVMTVLLVYISYRVYRNVISKENSK